MICWWQPLKGLNMANFKNPRTPQRKRRRKISKKKVLDRIKQRHDRMLETLVVVKASSISDLKIASMFSVPSELKD